MSLDARWSDALGQLRGRGRYRSLRPPAGIDFTSNDYLGYAGARTVSPSSPTLPVSGTASRLLRGHHPIWDEVEARLAAWHGAESALVLTSGYAANEGLLSAVIEPGDWVAADELCHASIIDGLRLARPRKFLFRHNDLNHLEDGLRAEVTNRPAGRELFVVTESLFSMDGDRTPLSELVALAERYGANVIVDEAHATGCFGPGGSGCVDATGVRGRVLATVHTGGKALGVPGAYVCGSGLLREYLVNRCRHLIFTTALPPAVGAWWLGALGRVNGDDAGRRMLHRNARRFRAALAEHGVAATGTEYIVPVALGDDERAVRVATRLQEQGYDVRAIRPPSVPPGTARVRISVHTDHGPAVLAALAGAIGEALRT
jgi:8-amino-7-oxononanoate synthase